MILKSLFVNLLKKRMFLPSEIVKFNLKLLKSLERVFYNLLETLIT
jgi:hypothetical protein